MSKFFNNSSKQMEEGIQFLNFVRKPITIFGSARIKPYEDPYKETEHLAWLLSNKGYSIITGGGPGIMEAANKGAKDGASDSVGISLSNLPQEHKSLYLEKNFHTDYFFVRKCLMTMKTEAFINMPGGFGTFDEVFEIITLIQTKKIKEVPVILYNKAFWQPMMDIIMKQFLLYGTADNSIYNYVKFADTPADVLKELKP